MFQFSSAHQINATRTIEWSEDDKICLLTEKGAIIFSFDIKFIDSAPSLYPQKHFIPSATKPFLTKIDKCIISHQRNLAKNASPFLDPLYLNEGFGSFYQNYQLASWSPATQQKGCILALLTYDSRLTLHAARKDCWHQLADVSAILEANHSLVGKKLGWKKSLETAKELQIQSICWSNVFEENESETCLLICGTSSGHFYFFRVKADENFEIKLVSTWSSELGEISYLSWFETYLIVCLKNGRVLVLRIPAESIDTSWSDFVLLPRAVLWMDSDDLPVFHIACRQKEKNIYELMFAKNRYFINVNFEETSFARKHRLSASNPIIYEANFKSSCTGLCFIDTHKFLYSALDAPLVEADYEAQYSEEPHSLLVDELTKLSTSYGLISSKNHVTTCLSQTLARYHDHLVLKEPTRLIVFSNLSFDTLKQKIEALCFSDKLDFKSCRLRNFMDYFQALRAFYSSGNSWIPVQLLDIAGNSDCVKLLNAFNLKCLRFVILCLLYCCSHRQLEPGRSEQLKKALDFLEDLIFDSHVKEILSKISKIKRLRLTDSQSQSLSNLVTWSKKKNLHVSSIKVQELQESCPICQASIEMDSIKDAKCPNKHRFGRCANSLLICDSFKVKYDKCRICGKHLYAIPYVWREYCHCLYCS